MQSLQGRGRTDGPCFFACRRWRVTARFWARVFRVSAWGCSLCLLSFLLSGWLCSGLLCSSSACGALWRGLRGGAACRPLGSPLLVLLSSGCSVALLLSSGFCGPSPCCCSSSLGSSSCVALCPCCPSASVGCGGCFVGASSPSSSSPGRPGPCSRAAAGFLLPGLLVGAVRGCALPSPCLLASSVLPEASLFVAPGLPLARLVINIRKKREENQKEKKKKKKKRGSE